MKIVRVAATPLNVPVAIDILGLPLWRLLSGARARVPV